MKLIRIAACFALIGSWSAANAKSECLFNPNNLTVTKNKVDTANKWLRVVDGGKAATTKSAPNKGNSSTVK